ncbi:protein of unknown function [Methylocaldum szegediense]|uniref:Uncharacterized protein n=1 Tax=Methylocaldum szegediense TaxID=73780 RepID=A0ABM9I711_9GAMM|nr:protein of unknown function [Methylocaldum szegediense]
MTQDVDADLLEKTKRTASGHARPSSTKTLIVTCHPEPTRSVFFGKLIPCYSRVFAITVEPADPSGCDRDRSQL